MRKIRQRKKMLIISPVKMLTWTDPNEWMVVKDLNGDGLISSGREVVGNNMITRYIGGERIQNRDLNRQRKVTA